MSPKSGYIQSMNPESFEQSNLELARSFLAKRMLPVAAAASALILPGCLDTQEEYCDPAVTTPEYEPYEVGIIGDSTGHQADEGDGAAGENNNRFCDAMPMDRVANVGVSGQTWRKLTYPGLFLAGTPYEGNMTSFNLPGETFLSESELATLGYTPTPDTNDIEPIDPQTAPDILVTIIGNNDLHNKNPAPQDPETPEEVLAEADYFLGTKYKYVPDGDMCTVAVEVARSDIWFDQNEISEYNDGLASRFDVVVNWEDVPTTNPEWLEPSDGVHPTIAGEQALRDRVALGVEACKTILNNAS